ncbi:hypothetical protein PV379_04265 [Streptomyces caniscabiei]|uniref:hypothetical protein n=1 Tax=Streptomyces caniscabiei TaxID=2746961 RepID=UPI0029AECEC7|nr:hypothetical protein [Streptomyces caniscabiei]MDX2776551.1 hypothetical protein [Streptomyces caniscabiei]
MNIHLIGSMRQFDEDFIPMQTIAETLHKHGVYIAHDWIAAVKSRKERQSKNEEELDWPLIVSANIQAILDSDALIIENSRFNYSSAYQTAIALRHNKPVLNLYRTDTPEYNKWPDKLFVSGIDNQLFHNMSYINNDDLPPIVERFLESITPKFIDLDIKISLDPSNMEYLKRKSHESNKSITSIVKDILIEKSREQM